MYGDVIPMKGIKETQDWAGELSDCNTDPTLSTSPPGSSGAKTVYRKGPELDRNG